MRSFCLILVLLSTGNVFSQLGFCSGSKGDPIFHEDFGPGMSTGSPLGSSITSYEFVTGDPNDGQYTVSGEIGQDNSSWHSRFPSTTVSGGKALIVNADYTAGKFYETRISGLCESTTYEFSAFVMNVHDPTSNVCPGGDIPVNVRFQIWDKTNTTLLRDGSTGNINGSATPFWEQYALTFSSQEGQDEVILKMFNNGAGGCGNDLAIDDIIFRSCGDLTEIASAETEEGELIVCEPEAPVTVELTATPDGAVYTSHAFQWQESSDGVNWQDIIGERSPLFTSEPIFSTTYLRVKVAENEVNLRDNLCSSASNTFAVIIVDTPLPPLSEGDVVACEGEGFPPLRVQVEDDEYVFWYGSPTGEDFLDAGTTFFTPQAPGTYYAEARKLNATCEPSERTAITLTLFSTPKVDDEIATICGDESLQLDAGPGDFTYEWNSGETGRTKTVSQPGNYSVVITNSNGCSAEKHFDIRAADVAGISEIFSEGTTVIVQPLNEGNFEYSLDGINFQESNIFEGISGGVYIAFQRDLSGCNTVSKEFPHIVVPKFITPNNDGFNDHFELKGVEYFEDSEIQIFNRYGKLLAAGKGDFFSWDGKYNEVDLPAEDYWYQIFIDGFEPVKGHFTLRR